MADPLVSANIPIANRRASVRELAGITTEAYTDTDLDRKIVSADALVLAYLPPGTAPTGGEDWFARFIVASNLCTATLIRMGIGDDANVRAAQSQTKTWLDIVKSINQTAPEQARRGVYATRGINAGSGSSSSSRGTFA